MQPTFTSTQAALISGVPFYTVDYWARTKFLTPTVARGTGRGRGRERLYSWGDVLRLRIARELRDQDVSLPTLRHVATKLARHDARLRDARYALIGRDVELAASIEELSALLLRPRRAPFAILLDLTAVAAAVEERLRRVDARRAAKPAKRARP